MYVVAKGQKYSEEFFHSHTIFFLTHDGTSRERRERGVNRKNVSHFNLFFADKVENGPRSLALSLPVGSSGSLKRVENWT